MSSTLNLTTEFKEEKKKSEKKEESSSNKTTGTVDVTVPSGSKNQELHEWYSYHLEHKSSWGGK